MENTFLNQPPTNTNPVNYEATKFLQCLGILEGFKGKCKNLHWAAPEPNIHKYLDDFLDIIADYQDALAEGYMGIHGKMGPTDVKAVPCDCTTAQEFISEVKTYILDFYRLLQEDSIHKGIKAETETLIQAINKYVYLFGLCE